MVSSVCCGINLAGIYSTSTCLSAHILFEKRLLRSSLKKVSDACSSGSKGRKLVTRRHGVAWKGLFPTKTPEGFLDESHQPGSPILNISPEVVPRISLADLIQVVAEDIQNLNKSLQNIIGAENPVLMDAFDEVIGAGGKRMRPTLVFLVAWATVGIIGLKKITQEHQRLAMISEMIHTASLIHDDILDESDMRRGKRTIHRLFGTRVAVLAGDFLFAQSSWQLACLGNIEVIKLFSQVIKDFASGEVKQASSLFDCNVELEEYLAKSYYKTASLIAASSKGAAILSNVDGRISDTMFEFGKNLGLSFQIVDDILDFTQLSEQLGKPAGNDLVKGNLTAPVIYALMKEPKLKEVIESGFQETGSIDEAVKLVVGAGGIERARDLAKERADLAIKCAGCLPHSPFRVALEQMVKYNLQRID